MVAKCIRYYENHRSDWRYKTEPLDDQAEKTVDRDVLNGAVDSVLGSGKVASGHEEGDSSLNQKSPNAQKRYSNSTPVNTINYYTEDGEPPKQPPTDVLLPFSVPHHLRKRSSVLGTGKRSPANKRPRTEASVNSMRNAEQADSHAYRNLPSDSGMPPPTPVRTERYGVQGPSPASGINTIARQVLGPYMESPAMGPKKRNFDGRDWEKIRSVLENSPITRVDGQDLITEDCETICQTPAGQTFERYKPRTSKLTRYESYRPLNIASFAAVAQPSAENRSNITPLGSSSALPNRTPWRAAGPATQLPRINTASRLDTLAQHRNSLDRQYLDMNPPTDDFGDALKRAELEIDWWADNEPSDWLQLENGDDVESFFRKIDEEMPPQLNDRAIRAVKVEYLNPPPNSRASFNGRIKSGAEPGFKASVRRLRLLRDQSTPELTATVEWEGWIVEERRRLEH